MAKINDTTTFPNTLPALNDHVIGTDVSDVGNSADGEVVTFKFEDIFDIIPNPVQYISQQRANPATISNLGNFEGVEIDGVWGVNTSDFGSAALKIEFSNDGVNWYGSTTLISAVSNISSTYQFKLIANFSSGQIRGMYHVANNTSTSGAYNGLLTNTVSGSSSSVTHVRMSYTGNATFLQIFGRAHGGWAVF